MNPYLEIVENLKGLEPIGAEPYGKVGRELDVALAGTVARTSLAGMERILNDQPETVTTSSANDEFGLVHLFSWAIPNDEALETIARYAPLVEVGAGTGYWAKLLRDRGVNIAATDRLAEGGHWKGVLWTDVIKMEATTAARIAPPQAALLMVWPTDYALEVLDHYQGDTIIYVGEHAGGCCAPSEFFTRLYIGWELVEGFDIPQWWGMHDRGSVWRRIRTGKPQGLDPRRLAGT